MTADRLDVIKDLVAEMEEIQPHRLPLWGLAKRFNALPQYEQALANLSGERRSPLKTRLMGPTERDEVQARCSVLRAAEKIVTAAVQADRFRPLPQNVVRAFNALAAPLRLKPHINEYTIKGKRQTYPTMDPPPGHELVASIIMLLWFLLQRWQTENRARLKRCESCQMWFVDGTRPNNAKRCARCPSDVVWTRARRREARHASQNPKGRRKPTGRRPQTRK